MNKILLLLMGRVKNYLFDKNVNLSALQTHEQDAFIAFQSTLLGFSCKCKWLVFRFSGQYYFDGDRHHRCWRCELPCACTCYLFTGFSRGNKQSFPQSSSFCMQRTLALRNSLKCKKYSALSCCCWLIFCAFTTFLARFSTKVYISNWNQASPPLESFQ